MKGKYLQWLENRSGSFFYYLPVNITYVDENNKVKFFSIPEKRIFRRTDNLQRSCGRFVGNYQNPKHSGRTVVIRLNT